MVADSYPSVNPLSDLIEEKFTTRYGSPHPGEVALAPDALGAVALGWSLCASWGVRSRDDGGSRCGCWRPECPLHGDHVCDLETGAGGSVKVLHDYTDVMGVALWPWRDMQWTRYHAKDKSTWRLHNPGFLLLLTQSGLIALRVAEYADDALATLTGELGDLPRAPSIIDPDGQRYVLFRRPESGVPFSNLHRLTPGVDFLLEQPHPILPGSLGPLGGKVRWAVSPWTLPVPCLPDAWRERLIGGGGSNGGSGARKPTGRLQSRTTSDPCPICGSEKDPCVAISPSRGICFRPPATAPEGWEFVREAAAGMGTVFRRVGGGSKGGPRVNRPAPPPVYPDLARTAETLHQAALDERLLPPLAADLGVSVESLVSLRVGWLDEESCYIFPEFDHQARVVGILRRTDDGKKLIAGGHHGIYLPDYSQAALSALRSEPVYLVEGASDVAALYSLRLGAAGRPFNAGGVDFLAALLRKFPSERDIIVLGEQDEHVNSQGQMIFPGRDGATKTAQAMANRLGRSILWAMPPSGAKDVRAWLQAQQIDLADPAAVTACRGRFVDGVRAGLVRVEPTECLVIPTEEEFRALWENMPDEPAEREAAEFEQEFDGTLVLSTTPTAEAVSASRAAEKPPVDAETAARVVELAEQLARSAVDAQAGADAQVSELSQLSRIRINPKNPNTGKLGQAPQEVFVRTWCDRAPKHLLEHRQRVEDAVMRIPCGLQNCPACAPTFKKRWYDRLCVAVAELTDVHIWDGAGDQKAAVRKRVFRAGTDAIFILHDDGLCRLTVLSTDPIPGSRQVSKDEGLAAIRQALGDIPLLSRKERGGRDAVSATSGFLPVVKKEPSWKRLCGVRKSTAHIDTILESESNNSPIKPNHWDITETTAYDYAVSWDCEYISDERRERIRDRITGSVLTGEIDGRECDAQMVMHPDPDSLDFWIQIVDAGEPFPVIDEVAEWWQKEYFSGILPLSGDEIQTPDPPTPDPVPSQILLFGGSEPLPPPPPPPVQAPAPPPPAPEASPTAVQPPQEPPAADPVPPPASTPPEPAPAALPPPEPSLPIGPQCFGCGAPMPADSDDTHCQPCVLALGRRDAG